MQLPSTSPIDKVSGRSIPAISRLAYLDVILEATQPDRTPTVEDMRRKIGAYVEALRVAGEAHSTRDWRSALAYRTPTIDTLRVLMLWGLVDQLSLGDSPEGFASSRNLVVRATAEGKRVAGLTPGERRDYVAQHLLESFPLFAQVLKVLQDVDVLIPELSDQSVTKGIPALVLVSENQDGWGELARLAGESVSGVLPREVRRGKLPHQNAVALEIGRHLRRRFGKRSPRSIKELTGAVNKAVTQAYLAPIGVDADWNSFDRCLRWARDAFLANDGRHVAGVPGWLAWATADFALEAGSYQIARRTASGSREAVKNAVIEAYRRIALLQPRASASPLIPVFEVRETAAFLSRVSDEVVDKMIGDLVFHPVLDSPEVVQLHLADLRVFAPSARPFRFGGRQYFYLTVHPRSTVGGN
jgi:hypothetical protein